MLVPQEPPVRDVRLGPPATTLAHEFTQIRGVRELPDRRLLVSDWLEPALYVADLKVHRSMPTQRPGLIYSPWPRATDRQGRLYFQEYGLPYVGFAPQDIWQATPDGWIALVRSKDYHIEWREPDGRVTRGPAVAWTAVPVTERDRVDYMRTFLENSGVGGRGSGNTNPTGISPTPDEMLAPERVKEMAA